MKKFISANKMLVVVLVVILALAVTGGAFAATYTLNKTVQSTVTILPVPSPTVTLTLPRATQVVTLYLNDLASIPMPNGYILDLGSVLENKIPKGDLWFRGTEINPDTVDVTFYGLPPGALGRFEISVPRTNPSVHHPCRLTVFLDNMPVGAPYPFTFTVTGTSL